MIQGSQFAPPHAKLFFNIDLHSSRPGQAFRCSVLISFSFFSALSCCNGACEQPRLRAMAAATLRVIVWIQLNDLL